MIVSAFDLITRMLPWPAAIYQHPDRAAIVVRDLQHNFEIEIPYWHLATPTDAAAHFASHLYLYRSQIAGWTGLRPIIWS